MADELLVDPEGNIIGGTGGLDSMTSSSGLDQPPTMLEQSQFNFTSRVFPEDLTMEDNNHYMVININVPTNWAGARRSAFTSGPPGQTETFLQDTFSKVDLLRFRPDPNVPGTAGQIGVLPRWTRRIAESIALHMPQSGLVYTEDNKYQEISMTAIAGDFISAIASGVGGAIGSMVGGAAGAKAGAEIGTNLVNAAGQISSVITKSGTALGTPIIPRVQVMFATRPQRQWVFEVFMMPRSESESKTVKNIIQSLRFYAAPEIGVGGFTFIPPAEFDITFYRGGKENMNLPRINTCVLERIDLDYAPQGDYTVFDKDGHSVAVRMSLSFREIEILHKRRIYEGF